MVARRDEVDLDEIIMEEARATRAESRVTFDVHKVSAARVTGDLDGLTRLVRNLLENAQRHADRLVSVGLSATTESVALVVADDGPGIQTSERDRIGDRSGRLDEARGHDSGRTGLGLAIVKVIIDAHSGPVAIVDSPTWARFGIRFSAWEPPDLPSRGDAAKPDSPPAALGGYS